MSDATVPYGGAVGRGKARALHLGDVLVVVQCPDALRRRRLGRRRTGC